MRHNQPSGTDSGAGIIVMVVLLFVAMGLAAHYRQQASIIWVTLNGWELALISLFDESAAAVHQWVARQPKDIWSYDQMSRLAAYTGNVMRWPFAVILAAAGFYALRTSPRYRYRRRLTIQQVLEESAKTFPAVRPIVNRAGSLLDEPLTSGPWRMAMHPIEFTLAHGLLIYDADHVTPVTKQPFDKRRVIPHREKMTQVFTDQLGGRYRDDLSNLRPYERALFAAFAARGLGDKKAADKLLAQLSTSFREPNPKKNTPGVIDCEGADALLQKTINEPLVRRVLETHAYKNTLLAGMLRLARRKGVLTSADFIWLRPTNRHLWMILNQLGGQTAPVEAAGSVAHFEAESLAQARVYVPAVDEAVKALMRALLDGAYLDYGASKKKLIPPQSNNTTETA